MPAMANTSSRVRWSDEEKLTLASHIARLRRAHPRMSLLDALREAQSFLPVERRREIRAWAIAAPILDAKIQLAEDILAQQKELLPPSGGQSQALHEAPAEPAPDSELPAVHTTSQADEGAPAPAAPEPAPLLQAPTPQTEPPIGQLEALVEALCQSPRVRKAVDELLAGALSRAARSLQLAPGTATAPEARDPTAAKILLAGFSRDATRALASALRTEFETLTWVHGEPAKSLDARARGCSIAVVPDELDQDLGQALREKGLPVLAHEGSAERLLQALLAHAD